MKNRIAVIKKAEQIKALLICSIIAIVPVYHIGYKLGGTIVQLFVQ